MDLSSTSNTKGKLIIQGRSEGGCGDYLREMIKYFLQRGPIIIGGGGGGVAINQEMAIYAMKLSIAHHS